jgi:hypothetical protein
VHSRGQKAPPHVSAEFRKTLSKPSPFGPRSVPVCPSTHTNRPPHLHQFASSPLPTPAPPCPTPPRPAPHLPGPSQRTAHAPKPGLVLPLPGPTQLPLRGGTAPGATHSGLDKSHSRPTDPPSQLPQSRHSRPTPISPPRSSHIYLPPLTSYTLHSSFFILHSPPSITASAPGHSVLPVIMPARQLPQPALPPHSRHRPGPVTRPPRLLPFIPFGPSVMLPMMTHPLPDTPFPTLLLAQAIRWASGRTATQSPLPHQTPGRHSPTHELERRQLKQASGASSCTASTSTPSNKSLELGSKTHHVSISCNLLVTINASIMTPSPPSSQAHSYHHSAPTPTFTDIHPHSPHTLTHALTGLAGLSIILCQRSAQRRHPNAGHEDDSFSPLQWVLHELQAPRTCAHLGSGALARIESQHATMHSTGTWFVTGNWMIGCDIHAMPSMCIHSTRVSWRIAISKGAAATREEVLEYSQIDRRCMLFMP